MLKIDNSSGYMYSIFALQTFPMISTHQCRIRVKIEGKSVITYYQDDF